MDQPSASKRPVTKDDGPELHAMPERHAVLDLNLTFDKSQMAAIRQGFRPTSMDDKWFIYFTEGCLYLHRSWTGVLIFQISFMPCVNGWHADQALVNRDHEQYGSMDHFEYRRLIVEIINTLLLDPDYNPVDGFVSALRLASQPNYLGSPQVVRDAITPLFARKVGWWLHLRDPSMPIVTAKEVQDVEIKVTHIFAGEDPDYTAMPWHSVEQLGQAAIARFNLNAEYCADESMFFVMLESVSAISMAIGKLLTAYLRDEMAEWKDANRQLDELEKFVESVMLGTADISHPGKTLRDYCWKPSILEDDDQEDEHPLDPHIHPCLNDKGQTVSISQPHTATPPESWDDMGAIATFVPGGDCPDEINGIAIESWADHPEGEDWNEVEGQMDDLEEPPMNVKHGLTPASGCVIEEADGRVWLVSPTNRFGGYMNTFPKGKEVDEVTWQGNAIKESFEEAGLQVRIVGYIGDVQRSTTVTRYYRAVRVGGMPVDMGWESQAVHLVPINKLSMFLDSPYDHKVIAMAYNIN